MATVITPETKEDFAPHIFLAGTIEMGKSEDWQQKMIKDLDDLDIVIANPRRGSFDQFNKKEIEHQINWELDKLSQADVVFFNFLPGTISPISLLEFGLLNGKDDRPVVVYCPEDYSRQDNVVITATHTWAGSQYCEVHTDFQTAMNSLRKHLEEILKIE